MTDKNTLLLATESALEPEMEIIDTHHHLWAEHLEAVGDSELYMVDDLCRDFNSGHNIVASVFVECLSRYRPDGPDHLRPVGETEWIVSQKVDKGIMNGIIGFADLTLGRKTEEALDAHMEIAGKRFKGVRHSVLWDPHPDVYKNYRNSPEHLLLDENYGKGAAELARRGLVLEVWAYFHQMQEVAVLARKYPTLKIVICHLGGPVATGAYANRRLEVLTEWRRQIKMLAEFPNVIMKLGGIGLRPFCTEQLLAHRSSRAIAAFWKPELLFCVETFGPERCMCESNFPPDSYLCDYVTIWNVFKRATVDLSIDERRMLFHGTAKRVYSL